MPNDVDITVGGSTAGVSRALAEMRNEVRTVMGEVTSALAVPLSVGGLVAYLGSVVDKAHEIHHESARFGIDAQQLQLIANAAKEQGIGLEQVARAMNKAEIAGYKAAQGGKAENEALAALNINAETFNKLKSDEKILAVADAWNAATDKNAAYNAVAAIFGSRFGTELIPLLSKGSEEIRRVGEEMGILGDKTTEALNRIYEARNRTLQQLNVFFSAEIANWNYIIQNGIARWDIFLAHLAATPGAVRTAEAALKKLQDQARNVAPAPATGAPPLDVEGGTVGAAVPGGGGSSSSGGSASADRIAALRERAAKAEEDALHKQESAQERLVSLQREKQQIISDLTAKAVAGTQTEEDYYKATAASAEKQKEIEATTKEITDATEKAAAAENKVREAAENEANDAARRVQLLQLEAAGHDDIAESLKKGWQFEDKIDDLAQRISDAYRSGDDELGDQLTKTLELVKQEEKLVAVETQRAAQEKAIAEAMERANKAGREFNDNRSQISSEQMDQLRKQGMSPAQIAALGGLGSGIATLVGGVNYTDYDVLRALRPDGTIDQALLDRLRTQNEIRDIRFQLSGTQQNPPANIGFIEAAQLNARATAVANRQLMDAQRQQSDALLALLQQLLASLYPYPGQH